MNFFFSLHFRFIKYFHKQKSMFKVLNICKLNLNSQFCIIWCKLSQTEFKLKTEIAVLNLTLS